MGAGGGLWLVGGLGGDRGALVTGACVCAGVGGGWTGWLLQYPGDGGTEKLSKTGGGKCANCKTITTHAMRCHATYRHKDDNSAAAL